MVPVVLSSSLFSPPHVDHRLARLLVVKVYGWVDLKTYQVI